MPSRDLLAAYRRKRDFSRTPEPAGKAGKGAGRRYLIQKHAATRLHYDFRLELNGVLKSWAVTKGPSLDPHEKRLAVEVEDHPLAYGSFEGTIPKGEYGGGTVMLWDEGSWEPIGDPEAGLTAGKLEFQLYGKRLQGAWTLVRMRDRPKDKGRHNWLLIKRTDDSAHAGDKDQLLSANDISVATGRNMEEIATGESDRPNSKTKADPHATRAKPHRSRATEDKPGMPAFSPPQLATASEAVPRGTGWVHEIKFDGYRGLAYIQDGDVHIYTRTGQDWTHRFKTLAAALKKLKAKSAILDGEIIAPTESGTGNFQVLQNAMRTGHEKELQYYVFDLLHLNGKNLTSLPLLERKARLKTLLKPLAAGGRVIYSEHVEGNGDKLLNKMCEQHFEGMVSKRADATYTSGRGPEWLKIKCHLRQEFAIGGFTLPIRGSRGIGALLIGYYQDGKLFYAGKVGTGFDTDSSISIRQRLETIRQTVCPFDKSPRDRGISWVKPQLVCEVEFGEWTDDGRLRHPSFKGLRDDKPATAVCREVSVPQSSSSTPKAKTVEPAVGGIRITHPERIVYTESEITKLQLAEYYLAVADCLLPHITNRLLSMLRCPDGIGKQCFFQRHLTNSRSPHFHEVDVPVNGRTERYLSIRDVEGLISLVQWGVIELHAWGCLADAPDKPDRIIFDLDPAPDVAWEQVTEAARDVRLRMSEFGLVSFVKTTGGKGLHVVVPIARTHGWAAIKAFARAVAESMQHDQPKRYIARAAKAAREGKVYIDYLRNDLTATAVAPYSARARSGAGVSMPIDWGELTPALDPAAFNVKTVPQFVKRRKTDPWSEVSIVRQRIAAENLRALQIEPRTRE